MTDTPTEPEKLFTCSCGGDVSKAIMINAQQKAREAPVCDKCFQEWAPEAHDGLAALRKDLSAIKHHYKHDIKDIQDTHERVFERIEEYKVEITALRESQRLADEWHNKCRASVNAVCNGSERDVRRAEMAEDDAHNAYRAHREKMGKK